MNLNRFVPLFLIVAIALIFSAQPAAAQSCSVSVSIAASATGSSSCFVPANAKAYVILTGTWAGTAQVQASYNQGVSWQRENSTTANQSFSLPPKSQARLVRAWFDTRTSGTLTGSVIYNPVTDALIKYTDVPIGSVAYASFGTAVAVDGTTTSHVADIEVRKAFTATGIGILNGGTTGTNKWAIALYDTSGGLVANGSTAGTTTSGNNAFQEIAFTTKVNLTPGIYYIFLQGNGTTDNFRAIATATFVTARAGTISSTVFGTFPLAISPPTTFTAAKGPIAYLY